MLAAAKGGGAVAAAFLFFLFFIQKKRMPKPMRARIAMAPMTPPTIAPVFDLEPLLLGSGVLDELAAELVVVDV